MNLWFFIFIFISATWIDVVDLGREGKLMWFSSRKTPYYLPWDNGVPNNNKSSERCAAIFYVGKEKWHVGIIMDIS